MRLTHTRIETNGVELECVKAGRGPLVLLLHGFPDGWPTWRRQLEALSKHFTVVAPALRGYDGSDKPKDIDDYQVRHLVRDAVGLIDALGRKKAHVVGHDWGGVIAWWLGMMYPYRLERLAILNAPHPVAFKRELATPGQLLRSWYTFVFQLPWLPEELLSCRNFYRLRKAIRSNFFHSDRISEETIDEMISSVEQPGALTAAINYYRAAGRALLTRANPKPAPIPNPTLVIWGEQDTALGKRLTYGLEPWVEQLDIHYVSDAGHWVHHEAPERVNEMLMQHLSKS